MAQACNNLLFLSLPASTSDRGFLSPFCNLPKSSSSFSLPQVDLIRRDQRCPVLSSISELPPHTWTKPSGRYYSSFRVSYRYQNEEEEEGEAEDCSFEQAVALFNSKEYYKCHDLLEALWVEAEEPCRTLFHGILQCAVGFHHLFNKNHKGAMMELGEGLSKLRKMNFENGPFHQFEQEISATLEFIYQTQIELAACSDDLCLTMDQSERSYQLLGGYGAGQQLYSLQNEHNNVAYIVFCRQPYSDPTGPPKVKLPTLNAREEHLLA